MNQLQCHRIQSLQVLVEPKDREATWDAVEVYFQCISECDLSDRECTISCTRQLRDAS